MRILVTGGLGFIGSALVRHLNRMGETEITVCDHLSVSEKWRNGIGLHVKDLVDVSDVDQLLHDCRFDVIFHMGARTDTQERDLKVLYDLNFVYSKKFFLAATKQSSRFIYASSAATYGDGSKGWSDQVSPLELRPLNPYGYYKNLFDIWVSQQDARPWQCCGLKYFNVYGPGESHKGRMASSIYHFYREMRVGESIKLFKSYRPDILDGHQRRDFVYIDDVVAVLGYILANSHVNGMLNVGTGTAHTFLDVVDALGKASGNPIAYEFVDMPDAIARGYQYFSQADMGTLREAQIPATSLEAGVAAYYRYLSSNVQEG